MNLFAFSAYDVIPLVAAGVTLVLGWLVAREKWNEPIGRVFTVLSAALVLWNLHLFILCSISDRALALSISQIPRKGGILLHPALLHLQFLVSSRILSRTRRVIIAFDYLVASVLAIGDSFGLLVADLRPTFWGFSSVGGPLYPAFSIFVVANTVATLWTLVYAYLASSDLRVKLQLKFWLAGTLVALPLGATNLLPAYGVKIYPLGNLGNVIWCSTITYAILRHRLLDIDVVVTKSIAYVVVALLVTLPTFGATLWLQSFFLGSASVQLSLALIAVFLVASALTRTLRLRTESRIGRSLFKAKYECRQAIASFTETIGRIFDETQIVESLAKSLTGTLGIRNVTIAFRDGPNRPIRVRYGSRTQLGVIDLEDEGLLVRILGERRSAVLNEELEGAAALRAIYDRNGWEVTIPLLSQEQVLGFFALGHRRDVFYADDLELLEALAAEAAVAIENARLYEELQRSQAMIRRADRSSALGVLAAGIAHEIRNPLVSIHTFFQLAPDRLDDAEFMTTFLQTAADEVRRISKLITELLSFARSPTTEFAATDLNEVLGGVLTLIGPEARQRRVALVTEFHQGDITVNGNFEQIRQVLLNLIFNALQAAPPEGGSILVRTSMSPESLFAELEVADDGIGITPDHLEQIFDPFFTTKATGTGLGLAIARQIILEHGGSIHVSSRLGKGTAFVIKLPIWRFPDHPDVPRSVSRGPNSRITPAPMGSRPA